MGVYISGMEMPTEESIGIFLYPDGRVHVWRLNAMVGQEYKAIPVPPHGRLGDLDALGSCGKECYGCPYDSCMLAEIVQDAPTIIPADKEGEG